MSIINIRPVVRGESKILLAVAGPTGSGKTFTALQIARGLVSKPSEIGFLDTENKRGSLYADILDGQFMIADLHPPFSPHRYREAIKEYQNAGVKVLVIDSVSHEWEGEGGCEDIAYAGDPKFPNWKKAKREHKQFVNTLLQSDMHIIVCIRAREKMDFSDMKNPVSLGIQPVCEKNFMFEMTASFIVEDEGKKQKFLKVPFFLKDALGSGNGYLGRETGKQIGVWVKTGGKEDPVIKKKEAEMLQAAEMGVAAVAAVWNTLTKPQQKIMSAHKDMCKKAAEEYERQEREAQETPQETLKANQIAAKQTKIELP